MSTQMIDPTAAGGHGPQPPQDLDAERSVLGGMLLSSTAINDVVEVLRPGSFYSPKHQAVFDCILDMTSRNEPVDPVTVAAELETRGELARVGGAPYLHTLIAMVPTAANAGYYARIVAEKAALRRMVEAGTRIQQYGYNADRNGAELNEVIDRAQAEVYALTDAATTQDYVLAGDLVQDTLDRWERIQNDPQQVGLPTGYTDLDAMTNGMRPGQMIVVAGRPGFGKSTVGLDIARRCAVKQRRGAVVFSLEMSRDEIIDRMVAAQARVRLSDILGGTMDDDDWTRVARAMSEIAEAPLFIDDSPGQTMATITAKSRRLKQRHDLGLIVIDYMQLMTSGRRVESRQQEVSEISRGCKLLAKELGVPVIAISQLNREPDNRTDHRPMLSDLRESGSLEQDADMVWLLFKPDHYDPDDNPGYVELIVAKQRAGSTGSIGLTNQQHYGRFVDWAGGA